MAEHAIIVTEVHDLLRLRGYAAYAVRSGRGLEGTCPNRCLMCDTCSRVFVEACEVLESDDCTVFSVQENGREVGAIWFIGSSLHGYFYDGKLWGKQVPIDLACRRMKARGIDPVLQLPVTEFTLAKWFRRSGWILQPYNGETVLINHQLVPVVNLSCRF